MKTCADSNQSVISLCRRIAFAGRWQRKLKTCESMASHLLTHTLSSSGRSGSIVLKKSATVCAADKYALEIEILTSGKGCWVQISHDSVLKRRFHRSVFCPFQKSDFFNRIDLKAPVMKGRNRSGCIKKLHGITLHHE